MRNVIGVSLAFMVGLLLAATAAVGQSIILSPGAPEGVGSLLPGTDPPTVMDLPSLTAGGDQTGIRQNNSVDVFDLDDIHFEFGDDWQGSETDYFILEICQRIATAVDPETGTPLSYMDLVVAHSEPVVQACAIDGIIMNLSGSAVIKFGDPINVYDHQGHFVGTYKYDYRPIYKIRRVWYGSLGWRTKTEIEFSTLWTVPPPAPPDPPGPGG